jgi:hypothetical protein
MRGRADGYQPLRGRERRSLASGVRMRTKTSDHHQAIWRDAAPSPSGLAPTGYSPRSHHLAGMVLYRPARDNALDSGNRRRWPRTKLATLSCVRAFRGAVMSERDADLGVDPRERAPSRTWLLGLPVSLAQGRGVGVLSGAS